MTSLPLLVSLAFAQSASAQQPGPFGPQPPPPSVQPSPFGPQPPPPGLPPSQPPPGAFGPQPPPAPGQFNPGAPPGAPMGPPPGGQLSPSGPGFSGSATGNFSAGGEAAVGANLGPDGSPMAPPPSADDEQAERDYSLIENNNIWGSTGLLRTAYAGSGAPGTFRVSFLTDWFSTSGFLCDPGNITPDGRARTCGPLGQPDKASHVGAFFALSATPFSFLELYGSLRTYANSDSQGKPQLLQVLGDTTFGAKAFSPTKLGQIFTFGGEAQLHLLNGAGGVGVAGGGTGATFRALGSADFRKPESQGGGVPLRINLNFAYDLDNSGKIVEGVEQARAAAAGKETSPISRIERFGLGINKVDFFKIALGAALPFKMFQPYAEWSVDIPVNRQGYQCHTADVSQGDECLGLDNFDNTKVDVTTEGGPGFKAVPSRLTLGVKATPFEHAFRGLSGHFAVDIGTSGTRTFIEEVAPEAPWTLYFGIAYAYDTKEKVPPPVPPPPPAPPPQMIPAPQNYIRGFVHEQGKQDAVADAIVSFQGGVQSPLATGPDGRFTTRNLDPGQYTFDVKAPGYKPGTCSGAIGTAGPGPVPGAPPGMPPGGAPGTFGPGAPPSPGMAPSPGPGQPNPFGPAPGPSPFGPGPGAPPVAPGMMPPPPAAPAVPTGPVYVDIDCPLEALPKMGSITGSVKDEGGAPISGAKVTLTAEGEAKVASADAGGGFNFKDLRPGSVTLKAEAPGFMVHVQQQDVLANEDAKPTLTLSKRPKTAQVKIEGKEIKISKQIHFETDSAKILGDSNSLMEEIADVLQHNPNVRKVEIQGHTDNTGSKEHNVQLSDERANAVRAWLINAGVDGSRLTAKGYGPDRPLSPNVTAANRAKNRRVQFIILEK